MLTLFRGCGEREGGGSGEKCLPALLIKDNRINSIQIWLQNVLKRYTVNVILTLKVDLRLPHISCKIWDFDKFLTVFGEGQPGFKVSQPNKIQGGVRTSRDIP